MNSSFEGMFVIALKPAERSTNAPRHRRVPSAKLEMRAIFDREEGIVSCMALHSQIAKVPARHSAARPASRERGPYEMLVNKANVPEPSCGRHLFPPKSKTDRRRAIAPFVSCLRKKGIIPLLANNDDSRDRNRSAEPCCVLTSLSEMGMLYLPKRRNTIRHASSPTQSISRAGASSFFFCSSATSACTTDQVNALTPLDALSGTAQLLFRTMECRALPFRLPRNLSCLRSCYSLRKATLPCSGRKCLKADRAMESRLTSPFRPTIYPVATVNATTLVV